MKTLSLDDLDITKACESGFEFEYIRDSDGKGTGVFLTVMGSHSEKVQKWIRKTLNAVRQREAMLVKRGKGEEVRTVEDDLDFGIESAAIRIIGWRGISQNGVELKFDWESAVRLCTINPEIYAQVIKQSNDFGNFTKRE